MIAAALIPLVVLGLIVVVVVALMQRGAGELTGVTLLRTYLYIGSITGVVAVAYGLSSLLGAAGAALFGTGFAYGGPLTATAGASDTRAAQDAVRGLTFTAFGGLFWLAHWLARKRVGQGDRGAQFRGYILVGTAAFGISTAIFLPTGFYQLLSLWLISRPGGYHEPIGEPLASGLVSGLIWILFLRQALDGFARRGTVPADPSDSAPER